MADPKTTPIVFVSHSGDESLVHALNRHAPQLEFVVGDWNESSAGSLLLADKIKTDIRRADLVLVVLSKRSAVSPWTHQEIGLAAGLGKPILPISALPQPSLPGVLHGLRWLPFRSDRAEETALEVAGRISEMLVRDQTRIFTTFDDYCEWWKTISESDYTRGPCLWAVPHDVWSWYLESWVQREGIQYHTLVRGDLPFDRKTAKMHVGDHRVVIGVGELSAVAEVSVFGNLSVETYYTPQFSEEMDRAFETTDENALRRWFAEMRLRPTEIEVRVSMDPGRAAGHRKRLGWLFLKYWEAQGTLRQNAAIGA